MDERDLHPPPPPSLLLVYEVYAVSLPLRPGLLPIVDLERHVVKALAALRQKFPDGRVGTGRLDEFDPRFTHPEHGRDYALLLDHLGFPRRGPEVLPVELGGGFDILDCIAEVVDPVEHTSPPQTDVGEPGL